MSLQYLSPLKVCFQLDCCDGCKDENYSNMWHVHGLATVLSQTIMSLYPDVNARIRDAYHKEVIPRVIDKSKPKIPYIIMWTRALARPLDDKWQPNHFVPCILPVGSSSKCTFNEAFPNTSRVCINKSQQDTAVSCSSNKMENTAILEVHLSKHHSRPKSCSASTTGGLKSFLSLLKRLICSVNRGKSPNHNLHHVLIITLLLD